MIKRVPIKMSIYDRRSALVPLWTATDAAGLEAAVVVHTSALLDALVELFELMWERATPTVVADADEPPGRTPSALDALDRQIIALLATTNSKDETVALTLGISHRTVRRHINRMMLLTGAETRFQLGDQARRRGWLGEVEQSLR
jgi:DNA-binding NarL/FixJ family response regulator